MSIRPTAIPQLQNMGLNPSVSLLNSGIATAVGADQQEKDRRNALIRSLIGGGVDIGTQALRNKGNLAMTEAQMQSPAQRALALNRLATGAAGLGQAGGISQGVRGVLGDINGQEAGSPILSQTGDGASQLLGGQGGVTGVPMGGEFTKSPDGAFQLGASEQVASNIPSSGMDLPLGMVRQQAQIDRNLSSESLNRARENKTYIDTDRSREKLEQERFKTEQGRYGKQWFDNITEIQAVGEQAKSSSGLPMKGLTVTPELAEDQANVARQYASDPKAYDKRLATLQKDTEGVVPLLRKMGELKKLVKPGVEAQIQRNLETDEYVISVSGSKQNARIKSILNSIVAQVPRIARLYGNTGVLTQIDVDNTLRDIPNALGSRELFDEQYKNLAEGLTAGTLSEAARLKNKRINDTYQSIYKDATGRDFSYGSGIGFKDAADGESGSSDQFFDDYLQRKTEQLKGL